MHDSLIYCGQPVSGSVLCVEEFSAKLREMEEWEIEFIIEMIIWGLPSVFTHTLQPSVPRVQRVRADISVTINGAR